MLKAFFTRVFGQFSWNSPPWFNRLRNQILYRPFHFFGAVAGIFIILFIGISAFHWYQNRPKPALVSAYITAPKITPVTEEALPDVLTVDFGLNKGGFIPKSVAPLNSIGKEVSDLIHIEPEKAGKWSWTTSNRLEFVPDEDWPAGQTYTIHFDKNLFAPHTKMQSLDYSFSTVPFDATIAEFKFYQDPTNPQIRQAVATINFNYPVKTKSFEEHATLRLEKLKDANSFSAPQFKFTVKYDDKKRVAYLTSEPLPLPEKVQYLVLTLDKGIQAETGSDKTTEVASSDVMIPDAASYFKISNLAASIVRNTQDHPEQILTLETTLGVKDSVLNPGLHVYLLPADYPATATEEAKTNYNWQNPGEVTADILKDSATVNLESLPTDRDYASLHSYKFNAPAGRYLFFKLDKGIEGFGGYKLGEDYSAILKVPAYPREIGFLHQGSLLALSGEQKLSVLVRGVPAVKFEIARVLPDDVNHLITQTSGSFDNPYFLNTDTFNQNNISEIFSEIQTFDATQPDLQQYTALNIGHYLSAKTNTGGPQGLFLLKALGWDKQKNEALLDAPSTSRLILITNLGLLVKDNGDGSHDVFVDSIAEGTPSANTTISVLGKNGLPIISRTTDASGHANIPSLKDFTDDREATVYLAKKGNDVSFIPYKNFDRDLNLSRFDVGGVYNQADIQTLSAYLFSDRGIYRPGDLAHIGVIVKQAYAEAQPAGLPVQITVTDPRGTTVKEQQLTLDATGYFTLDFQTNPTSPTGQYNINLFIVKDKRPSSLLGSTSIQVQEFLPDRMRISSALSSMSKGWISPLKLTSTVNLWNLYGAPATDRKVTAKIILTPKSVQFSEYPNYVFFDPLLDPKKPPKVFTDTLTDTTTDKNGQAQFDLNLERFDKATYQLTIYSEGFEAEGGRSVTTQTTGLVSPLDYLVGYKPDGDLNYIKQKGQRSIHFIAVNPELKLQNLKNLTMQIAALRPVTTLVKNPDGTFQYQSIQQTQIVSTEPFTVSEQGTDFALPSDQIGDFILTIFDEHHTELSKLKFSVVGPSQAPLAKNAELTLKLNKDVYAPGEDIEIQMTAPYTGTGLITIERDKVYASQWFVSKTMNSVQKIHIPANFQGNGYINVAFIRDWNSPEIFISPLSYSVVPFSVNHEQHTIHIDLTTPSLARPGDAFPIQYKTDKPAKIIVFAVDEGILQAANYTVPDPLGYFFQKRALEVITKQTVDQILPKFIERRELSSVGGDGGEAALRSHLNPFKRKTEAPVVFWSGIIDADSTMRQVVYQVPNYFNGTLHVMAVAVAANAVGAADKKSEVRGYFVINPNVPTFVAPGDEFFVTASVANNVKGSGKDAKVSLLLKSSPQLEILSDASQELTIPEGQEKPIRYKVRAKNELSGAELNFSAQLGDKASTMSATLSVRPASAYFTSVISGTSDKATQTVKLDRDLYPEYRDIEAVASTSPLILAAGLQRYLDNFPFGCTEQLVSKAFPLVATGTLHGLGGDPQAITQKIMATVQMLGQRQMTSGAFSYWPDMGENTNNEFDSVYAMHFLTEAKAQGYDVPGEMFRAGIGYLKEVAQRDATNLTEARLQAYAIYILTRNEIVTTNYLTHLQLYLEKDQKNSWYEDMTSVYMAATYQLLKNYEEADRLIAHYRLHADHPEFSYDFYDNKIADAQYLFILARHFPNQLSKMGPSVVMSLASELNNDSINTVFSSYASLALSAYAQATELLKPANLSISEVLKDDQIKNLFSDDNQFIKVKISDPALKIQFNNPTKQTYFYQVTESGFDKQLSDKIVKNNLEIYREYHDAKNTVITSASLGNEIEVHVRVRALNNTTLTNIAIVDLLPGGFEVVRDSVKNDGIDYADIREDRVVFFLTVGTDPSEIIYRIKATNAGKFTIPPIYANSMYDPSVNAHGVAGEMDVEKN